MGFFEFVKSVGKKLLGASEAQAASGEELTKEVASHGFETSGLSISSEGNKVTLSGNVKSQEEAERILLALGNTVGVAEVDMAGLTVAAQEAQATLYTVKKGDTLWKTAEQHYGKGALYTKIVEANNPPIVNPDLIQPGWVLRIPTA
jgi:nucleoid-associated protein YgaU